MSAKIWLDRRTWLEKAGWLALCLAVAVGGYYAIGQSQDASSPRVVANTALVRTSLDERIPLVPAWQFVYAAVYTSMIIPIFVVHDRKLFAKVAQSYLAVLVVCLPAWLLFPVTTKGFRPEVADVDKSTLHGWGLAFNYFCDPPFNCFPSLHLGAAVCAGLGAWKADRPTGALSLLLAVLIGFSTLFVKQHYLADVVAGSALAAVSWWLIVRPHPSPMTPEHVRAARGGLAVYAVVYLVFVFGIFASLRAAGVEPWRAAR